MKKAWEKLSTHLSHLLTSVTQNKKSHVKSATCSRFFQNIFERLLVCLYLSPFNFFVVITPLEKVHFGVVPLVHTL